MVYELKHPFRDGTTHVVFEPLDFIARLAALVPEGANDLPLNGERLRQDALGVEATVVNGQVLLKNREHTGALPGQLLRQ